MPGFPDVAPLDPDPELELDPPFCAVVPEDPEGEGEGEDEPDPELPLRDFTSVASCWKIRYTARNTAGFRTGSAATRASTAGYRSAGRRGSRSSTARRGSAGRSRGRGEDADPENPPLATVPPEEEDPDPEVPLLELPELPEDPPLEPPEAIVPCLRNLPAREKEKEWRPFPIRCPSNLTNSHRWLPFHRKWSHRSRPFRWFRSSNRKFRRSPSSNPKKNFRRSLPFLPCFPYYRRSNHSPLNLTQAK